MQRRKLIAVVGGLALLGGAVVVLRNESAPPPPRAFERFLDEKVEYVPDTQRLVTPSDLTLTALDRTSLRANWTATGGLGYGGFEVRWGGRTRLVQGTETELSDLDANADVEVEVRALDAMGNRSEPATARAVPRLLYNDAWLAGLVMPIDLFDGPEALAPRRWRVFDGGNTDCLGLRPLNGKRLEITCDRVDLQSNVPVRLGMPAGDGAVGRVVLTTDGPIGHGRGDSELRIALVPEPFHDLGHLVEPFPPGAVVLRVTPFNAYFDVGGGVPAADLVTGTFPPPTPGVRHRWELRVRPDRVVALRDGVEVASAPGTVPWTVARPRLVFRQAQHTLVDTFAMGGAPDSPVPAAVVTLGPSVREGGAASMGNLPDPVLHNASSVRVVASVVAERTAPITVELGTRSAPAVFMTPNQELHPSRASVVYADFPLPSPDSNPKLRLRSDGNVTVYESHVVVADGQDTRRPLPRLTDRAHPDPRVPAPTLSVLHESASGANFPRGGKARVTVELPHAEVREIAAIKGLEVDLDGDRIAVLPTNGSAGGRHEFLVSLDDVPTGRHEFAVRVLPVDERREVRSQEQTFDIRPL
ncbi:fibronectin type III domain-containing protein [Saccharothrix deserti]|uniref:fibronectin type III domain-containing protein n=1 Tax=Saccharothrix deserti TaxID=2593674 RepID=UPI00131CD262|nr:fibronectin type III domain-containing protein [Saccharothrix deserti]